MNLQNGMIWTTINRSICLMQRRMLSTRPILHRYLVDSYSQNPRPTDKVPDVTTFLSKIGRGMNEYADKFETWDEFISTDGKNLKKKGIDVRQRRYILGWLDRFKRGIELTEYKRGKKSWGGERRRKEIRARHFGRLRAEEKEKERG